MAADGASPLTRAQRHWIALYTRHKGEFVLDLASQTTNRGDARYTPPVLATHALCTETAPMVKPNGPVFPILSQDPQRILRCQVLSEQVVLQEFRPGGMVEIVLDAEALRQLLAALPTHLQAAPILETPIAPCGEYSHVARHSIQTASGQETLLIPEGREKP